MKFSRVVVIVLVQLLLGSTLSGMDESYKRLHGEFVERGLAELSPIRGFVGLSPLIKNQVRFGDPSDPQVKLSKLLFNVVGTQMNPTTYEPFKYLTSVSVGCLVVSVYNKQLHNCKEEKSDCELIAALKDTFKAKRKKGGRLKNLCTLLYETCEQEADKRTYSDLAVQALLVFLCKKDDSLESFEQYKDFIFSKIESNEFGIADEDYLFCIDTFLRLKYHDQFFPPMLEWQRDIDTTRGTLSCDCFYTALRQLFNDLLYNSDKKQFSVEKLRETRLGIFYEMEKSVLEHVQSPEVRSQWTNIIEAIPDLEYCKEHDAVKPTFDNLKKILQVLLSDSGREIEGISLEDSCNYLPGTTDHDISIQSHTTIVNKTQIAFKVVPNYERKPYVVTLSFTPKHAEVLRPDTIDYEELAMMRRGIIPKSKECEIAEQLDKKFEDEGLTELEVDCLSLFASYSNFNQYYSSLLQQVRLFSLPMDSQEQMYKTGLQWIRALSYWHRKYEKTALHVLASIFASLNNNDYVLALLVRLIKINYQLHQKIKEFILQYNEQLDYDEQNDILYELAQKQAWKDEDFNDLMVTIAKRVPDREVVSRSARIAFDGSNLTKLYLDLARAECPRDSSLMQCVYKRIENEGTPDELRRVCYLAPFLRRDGIHIPSDYS